MATFYGNIQKTENYWDANVLAAYPLAENSDDETGRFGITLGQYGNAVTYTTVAGKQCTWNFQSNSGAFTNGAEFTLLNGRTQWTIEYDQYMISEQNRPNFSIEDSTKFFHVYTEATERWATDVNNVYRYYSAAGAITASTWKHIAITKDGNDVKMYTDNTLSNSYTNGTWNFDTATRMRVGADWYFAGNYFNGHMANLVFSDIARATFPTVKV